MNLIAKICTKTVKTPIIGNVVEFNRDYTYNKKWYNESIDLINQALNKISYEMKLSHIASEALKLAKFEDNLLQLRNWAVYYLSTNDESDCREFQNALNSFSWNLTIDM